MEHCPVEVWQKILAFACTDGGHTGCSLSLVSRFMRLAVLPVRFCSVELTSQDRLLAFSTILSRWESRANIRHLFVTVDIPLWGPNAIRGTRRSMLDEGFRYILVRAAPTLNTLVIHSPDTFDVAGTNIHFPFLTDFSVPYLRPSSSPFIAACPSRVETKPQGGHFPSLQRLHLTECFNTRDSVWEEIAELAPAITTIKLSGIQSYTDLPKFLRILLNAPVANRQGDSEWKAPAAEGEDAEYKSTSEAAMKATELCSYLPNLRHVSVECPVYEDDGWCDIGMSVHSLMLNGLESIARSCVSENGVGRLYVSKKTKPCSVGEARSNWIGVVNGGDGPWPLGTAQLSPPVVSSVRRFDRTGWYQNSRI